VLQAFHDSGNIVVQISDDGAGLDHERILTHARAKGIFQRELASVRPRFITSYFSQDFDGGQSV